MAKILIRGVERTINGKHFTHKFKETDIGIMDENAVTHLARRRFLQAAAASATMTSKSAAASSKETPLFRFVQWNDLHVENFTPNDYDLANQKARYLAKSLNAATHCPVPDFVVAVGDMIHGNHGQTSLTPDFEKFETLTAKLTCPLYPAVGNHENLSSGEGDPTKEGPYWKTFGRDRTNYTFDHGGLLFVIINNSGAPGSNQADVGIRRVRTSTAGHATTVTTPMRNMPRTNHT